MARERRLHPAVERYLGPVAIAQFVDAVWFTFWPLGLTKGGKNAFDNGFGFWDGHRQDLPYETSPYENPFGNPAYPDWEGRLARLPVQGRANEDVSSQGD